nr:hypothetical protein CTI12_AA475510 [Tanacetum cinerariifolium]
MIKILPNDRKAEKSRKRRRNAGGSSSKSSKKDKALIDSNNDDIPKIKELVKKDELTIADLEGAGLEILKSRYKNNVELEYHVDQIKATIPDIHFYNGDFYYLAYLIMEKIYASYLTKHYAVRKTRENISSKLRWGYGFLSSMKVKRTDDKEYEFSYADFSRLNINDIEDMNMLKISFQHQMASISSTTTYVTLEPNVAFQCEKGIIDFNNEITLLENKNLLYQTMLKFLSNCCESTALTKQPLAYYLEYLRELWYFAKVDAASNTIIFTLSCSKKPLYFELGDFSTITGLKYSETYEALPLKETVRAGHVDQVMEEADSNVESISDDEILFILRNDEEGNDFDRELSMINEVAADHVVDEILTRSTRRIPIQYFHCTS